ncbi:MAG: hypothetical protein ACRYGM_20255 [Janthinobacterium lividum]
MPADTTASPDRPSEDKQDALADELRFIAEWESGSMPLPGTIVRARQIYRAHPWIAGR